MGNIDVIHLSQGVSDGNCVVTALDENLHNSRQAVYPNPTNGKIYWYETQNWTLLNVSGLEIQKGQGIEIDLSNLQSGVYFLKLDETVHRITKN